MRDRSAPRPQNQKENTVTNDEMGDFLWQRHERGEHVAKIGEVELDTFVRLVVKNPRTGQPMIVRASVLAKNTSLGEDSAVLTECGPGYTEFPLEYSCLAFLPPRS